MEQTVPVAWPFWYRIAFRFAFSYFALYIFLFPVLDYFSAIAFLGYIPSAISNWMVNNFNEHFLHYKDQLVPLNGSGDTSFAWAQVAMNLSLAAIGCIVWSILGRKAESHYRAEYFIKTSMRYFVALFAFVYGIIKIFALQMSFPSLSYLATPLGDFLPMRLSWLFVGYSTPYQVFSGVMEVVVGLLLIYRRTATLGLLIGLGVFLNVMMINLCYDVPVKIFSIHLTVMVFLLLLNDAKRLVAIFILNRPADANKQFHYQPAKRPSKIIRIALKVFFMVLVLLSTVDVFSWSKMKNAAKVMKPIPYGYYDVTRFIKDGDTIPVLANDTLVWKDMIFEFDPKYPYVTVDSQDTMFEQVYRRGILYYAPDTIKKVIQCYQYKKNDSTFLFNLRYEFRGTDTIDFTSSKGKSDYKIRIVRNNRKFQLAEKQFHWLSESNR